MPQRQFVELVHILRMLVEDAQRRLEHLAPAALIRIRLVGHRSLLLRVARDENQRQGQPILHGGQICNQKAIAPRNIDTTLSSFSVNSMPPYTEPTRYSFGSSPPSS